MLCDTYQSVDLESKDGKQFLRRVIRDCDWTARATQATDWNVEFSRVIKGKIGEPETVIVVRTNAHISRTGKLGDIQSFSDSSAVRVVEPRQVFLNGTDTAVLAKMLLDGARLTVHCSSGSTHSSRHGLSFYWLEATVTGCAYGAVSIGCQTTAKDGITLVSGAVDLVRI